MPVSDYTPSTSDVAKFLRARTRDAFGTEVGDFTDATTPNKEQASGLIAEAIDEVSDALGSDVPVDYLRTAKRLVTMLAAANIEMSFFPEQAAQNNSMYDKLMTRVNALRSSLETDISEEEETEIAPTQFDFPDPLGWNRIQW